MVQVLVVAVTVMLVVSTADALASNQDMFTNSTASWNTASGTNRSNRRQLTHGGGNNPRWATIFYSHGQFSLETQITGGQTGSFSAGRVDLSVSNGVTTPNTRTATLPGGGLARVTRNRVMLVRPTSQAQLRP